LVCRDGTGGMAEGKWVYSTPGVPKGLTWKNDPGVTYTKFGYTEYIELSYKNEVYVSEMLIGEPRGMMIMIMMIILIMMMMMMIVIMIIIMMMIMMFTL
jgi:hypothetical protein